MIGRNKEYKAFSTIRNSGKAELVALFGRRRVGKTYLIKQYFNNTFDFYFTGSYETPKDVQLIQFNTELNRYSNGNYPIAKNWFSAFQQLQDYLSKSKKKELIVFIDELPWLDTAKSNFLPAFAYFWNSWGSSQNKLKLFVCGSATTWMTSKFIGDKGGLHGRVTHQMYLAPFTLQETEHMILSKGIKWNRYQITEAYMIFGGIPFYLDMLTKELTFNQNIDNLFFKKAAPLKLEYNFLFRSLFNNAQIYQRIIETLAKKNKGLTLSEIKVALKLTSGGSITEVLENLCQCDFIRKYSSFGKKERGVVYQLSDLFSLFYLKFVANNNSLDENFWSNMQDNPTRKNWNGYAFEQVCLHHVQQIKQTLGISGVLNSVCSWNCQPITENDGTTWNGTQIDLLIDRNDNVINLCEIKYSSEEFIITKEYHKTLQNRIETFRHHTKTKKAIQTTMITTYGLKNNIYYDIVSQEVTVNDLFN